MKRHPRLKLEWAVSEHGGWKATAPDGTTYNVQGVEGFYWPVFWRPGTSGFTHADEDFPLEDELFGPPDFCHTKAQAIRWCEVDAHRRQG